MRFDSGPFLALLVAAVALYRLAPWSVARLGLLGLSYLFYGFEHPWYGALLATSTLIDYGVARQLEIAKSPRRRQALLGLSLAANLGLLLGFKYAGFFVESLSEVFSLVGGSADLPRPSWVLPVGISFYTFQTLSYTFDVYYGKVRAERDLGLFGLYVAFFPQLLAGPIERADRLLAQLRSPRQVSQGDLEAGIERVLLGLVKKCVLADRLALFVDPVYAAPSAADGAALALATIGFAAQVYLDFSGYCDIAIGAARLIGVKLSENFRSPLLARSPVEFWARWHITLGAWFRDYVLATLVRRRTPGLLRRLANVVLVFLLIGLWHGPAWHFVTFGAMSGLFVAGHEGLRLLLKRRRGEPLLGGGNPWWTAASYAFMAVHGVVLAALFRSPTLTDARQVLWGIVTGSWQVSPALFPTAALLALCFVLGLSPVWSPLFFKHWKNRRSHNPTLAAALRGLWLTALLLLATHLGIEASERFIYFQF